MAGIRRRDFLGFLGGGVVGAALSPLPWKLLDDAAIWTQNWSWLPRLPRGPIDHVFTHCTLCPIGCGLQVRRVGGNPCGLAGVADHPVSHGALCPLGFGGHQLAFHPARLREPQRRRGGEGTQGWVPQSPQEALGQLAEWVAELRGAGAAQTLGVLDARPGRVLSDAYRRFLTAVGGGRYLVAGDRGLATEPLEEMLGAPPPGLGIDVERTGTLLSFGAPLLEGWGSPRRATRARLIQVDSRPSPTALRADVWLRIAPGSEAALALGLAHLMVAEGTYDREAIRNRATDFLALRTLLESFPPERVAERTGLPVEMIRQTARRFARERPSVALPAIDPGGGPLGRESGLAIWALNLLAGSLGREGGLVARRALPSAVTEEEALVPVERLSELADESLRLLVIDGDLPGQALPWNHVARVLRADARVVSLAPFRLGHALHADLHIPSPAPLESLAEVTPAFDAPRATLALGRPLWPTLAGTRAPGDLLATLAERLGLPTPFGANAETHTAALRARVAAIHDRGEGVLFTPRRVVEADGERILGERQPMARVASPDRLWEKLMDGACWVDAADPDWSATSFTFLGSRGIARRAAGRPAGTPAAAERIEPSDAQSNEAYQRLFLAGQGYDYPPDLRERAGITARTSATELLRRGVVPEARVESEAFPLIAMPFGAQGATGQAAVAPILAKIYRESGLRAAAGEAIVHPETARRHGLRPGRRAWIETPAGRRRVRIRCDALALPNLIHLPIGPSEACLGWTESFEDPLALCASDARGVWRLQPARLRRA